MEHIINFIFIAPIFLAPVILLRYVILRRAVSKGNSFLIALTYGFIAWIIVRVIQDITLEEPIPSVIPSVVWSIINYIILCCGRRKSIKEPKPKKSKGKMLLGVENLLFVPICVCLLYVVNVGVYMDLYLGVAIAALCSMILVKFCVIKPHSIPFKILAFVMQIVSLIPVSFEEYWRLDIPWLILHIASLLCIYIVLFLTTRKSILYLQNKVRADEPPSDKVDPRITRGIIIAIVILFLITAYTEGIGPFANL